MIGPDWFRSGNKYWQSHAVLEMRNSSLCDLEASNRSHSSDIHAPVFPGLVTRFFRRHSSTFANFHIHSQPKTKDLNRKNDWQIFIYYPRNWYSKSFANRTPPKKEVCVIREIKEILLF